MPTIQIKPGKYKGHYRVAPFEEDPVTGWITGNRTLHLAAGRYLVDAGAVIGESQFYFVVKADGAIVVEKPRVAAKARKGVLAFNTAQVRIDPGELRGKWEPSWVKNKKPFDGSAGTVREHLIRGLVYRIDTLATLDGGSSGTPSWFDFLVKPDGFPQSRNSVAARGGRELRFNTRQVFVDPKHLGSGQLSVSGYGRIPKSGRTIEVIRSLKYSMKAGSDAATVTFNVS